MIALYPFSMQPAFDPRPWGTLDLSPIYPDRKFDEKIGEEFGGFIVSLTNFGFFVELENYFIEGLVKLASLTDDAYQYYEKEYLIKGRRTGRKFRLGDAVRVKVARINAFRSQIDFEWVQARSS